MHTLFFNLFISKGISAMPKLSKAQWTTVIVAVVIVLLLMWSMNNVSAVKDVARKAKIK